METKLITGSGKEILNPSREMIEHELTHVLAAEYPTDYLILDRVDRNVSYMQTRPQNKQHYEGVFLIEYRDGVAKRHFVGYVEAGIPLLNVLESYVNEDDAWKTLTVWRDVSHSFEDLRSSMPSEELASSYFPENEWEQSLEEKEQRDEKFWQTWDKAAEDAT